MTDFLYDMQRYGGRASIYIKILLYTFRKYKKSKQTRLFGFLFLKLLHQGIILRYHLNVI